SFKTNLIGSLFAIYRDGMNSVDLPYRYICFFKIYEAWYTRHEKFFVVKNRPDQKITKNLLATAYRKTFHDAFIDKQFDSKEVYKHLNHIRNCLVHPIIDRDIMDYCCLDSIENIERLEAMSNLMERVATKILDIELSLMAKIEPDIEKLLCIYKKVQ
ncbi:MAG: methylamine utilization protein MauJ, partial [Gammaproteobacteria bacterium]